MVLCFLSTSCGGWKRRNEISWRDEVERDVRRREGEILFAWNSHSRLINMDEGREEREGERMKRKKRRDEGMKEWKRKKKKKSGKRGRKVWLLFLFSFSSSSSSWSVRSIQSNLFCCLSLFLPLLFLFLSISSSSSFLLQLEATNICQHFKNEPEGWTGMKGKRWEKRFNSVPLLSPFFLLSLSSVNESKDTHVIKMVEQDKRRVDIDGKFWKAIQMSSNKNSFFIIMILFLSSSWFSSSLNHSFFFLVLHSKSFFSDPTFILFYFPEAENGTEDWTKLQARFRVR